MPRFSRRTKIITGFLAAIAAALIIVALTRSASGVPQDFTDARLQGAIIAQNIVDLSNQSTADLTQVSTLDQKGDYGDALKLTTDLVSQSQSIRDQAVQLSSQVSEMTKDLSGITSFDAQQAALESISSRLAVINQLINYSGDLERLEQALSARFAGASGDPATIQAIVNQINTDVNAINNYNAQAGQAMDRFDTIVGK